MNHDIWCTICGMLALLYPLGIDIFIRKEFIDDIHINRVYPDNSTSGHEIASLLNAYNITDMIMTSFSLILVLPILFTLCNMCYCYGVGDNDKVKETFNKITDYVGTIFMGINIWNGIVILCYCFAYAFVKYDTALVKGVLFANMFIRYPMFISIPIVSVVICILIDIVIVIVQFYCKLFPKSNISGFIGSCWYWIVDYFTCRETPVHMETPVEENNSYSLAEHTV